MSFLPKDYKAPESNSNYLKLEEGATKFRIVSECITGYEYWTEANKPVRLKEAPQEKPKDIRMNEDDSYTVKHFWAFKVLDRKDSGVKILELTQATIQRAIQALVEDEEWGDPTAYDITINRTGQKLDTKYSIVPSPHKALTKEEQSIIARTEIDLNALFQGANPFEKQDEVNIKDVPF